MLSPPTRASRQAPRNSIAQKRRQRRGFIKGFFLLFLPTAPLSGLGIGGRETLEVSTAETLLTEREAVHVDITTAALDVPVESAELVA
jgi:hypothetical protein